MTQPDGQPWFHAALQLLDLRRQDRVLMLHAEPSQVRDATALVGGRGEVTVVQPDRATAEAIAAMALPQVEVLAHTTHGDEHFGSFDAVLVAPHWQLPWAKGAYAELPRRNLRPGGRLVFDLPAPDMLPNLSAACTDLGWPDERLALLRGLRDDELTDILRNAGLRRVQALLGTHLLNLDSPFALSEAFCDRLRLGEQERTELGRALVHRLGSTDAVDILVHRTRVQALR